MSKLGNALAWRLAPGFLGQIARHAVRRHPYLWGEDLSRIRVAPGVLLNDALLNCASGTITIEKDAFLGHGVLVLAATHDHREIGPLRRDAVPDRGCDIVIGEGAWIASNATILGPSVVGQHAVVAAGAVVRGDVPPFTVVGGVPARPVLRIAEGPAE